jgi:pimeloyl-ACP methyl ester carboxylesterase
LSRIFKRIALGVLFYLVALLAVAAVLVASGHLSQPKSLKSVTDPFSRMDFSGLPPITRYPARDGAQLSYRLYPAGDAQVAVLIHGSAGSSKDMHRMARALQQRGVTVFVPDLRGHGANYPHGDISYPGQLDDDMADFMQAIHPRYQRARWTLIGFSSGGGFALRIAGGAPGKLFDRFVFLSPYLRYNAPTVRPASPNEKADPQHNAWYSVSIKRIVGLSIFNFFGIHHFDGLPVLAFPVPGDIEDTTPTYSFRLEENFQPHKNYAADIRAIPKPAQVLVGSQDELFLPEKFAPVFDKSRSDIPVTIVPGMGHSDMITKPEPINAVVNLFPNLRPAAHPPAAHPPGAGSAASPWSTRPAPDRDCAPPSPASNRSTTFR